MASKQSALRSFLIAALAGSVAAGTYTLAADTSDTGETAASTTETSTAPTEEITPFTTAAAGSCLTWQVGPDGAITGFEQADCAGEHRFEVSLRQDLSLIHI